MCVRIARKQKVKLQDGFWSNDGWKTTYKQQILAANSLLKIFKPLAIINALNLKECQWITSLRVKALNPVIIREQEKLEAEEKRLTEALAKEQEKTIEKTDEAPPVIAKPFSTNKSKLRNLD